MNWARAVELVCVLRHLSGKTMGSTFATCPVAWHEIAPPRPPFDGEGLLIVSIGPARPDSTRSIAASVVVVTVGACSRWW